MLRNMFLNSGVDEDNVSCFEREAMEMHQPMTVYM